MIQKIPELVTNIIAPALAIITLMFLPSIIELKRPRDAGPRQISSFLHPMEPVEMRSLIDLEKTKLDSVSPTKVSFFTNLLFDLELEL